MLHDMQKEQTNRLPGEEFCEGCSDRKALQVSYGKRITFEFRDELLPRASWRSCTVARLGQVKATNTHKKIESLGLCVTLGTLQKC